MKTIFVILFGLISISTYAKQYSTQIGIGFGRVYVTPYYSADKNIIKIKSPFYNSSDNHSSFERISFMQTPTIYFSTKIFRNLFCRFNTSYSNRVYFFDYTGVILEPSGIHPERNYYNNINYDRHLDLNIGFQYNFNFRKFRVYPALELMREMIFTKHKNYYTLNSNIYKSYVETFQSRNVVYGINALLGVEYKFNKKVSFTYETGLFENYFSIISRLSINYNL